MIEILYGNLKQWDLGRKAVITPAPDETVDEVHIYGEDDPVALNVELLHEDDSVLADIPNIFLQLSQTIFICVVMRSPDGCCRTTEKKPFRIKPRAKPDDYVYTETEVKNYAALEARIVELEENGGAGGGNVESVNGKTGAVKLTAADVGALPANTEIPSIEGLATKNYVDVAIAGIPKNYPLIEATETTAEIAPNTYYLWGEVESLNITLGAETEGTASEYCFQFTSGATATTLTVPESVKWVSKPSIEANKTYQVSILNGIGVIVGA